MHVCVSVRERDKKSETKNSVRERGRKNDKGCEGVRQIVYMLVIKSNDK